jgi:hypothetical protein
LHLSYPRYRVLDRNAKQTFTPPGTPQKIVIGREENVCPTLLGCRQV